MTIHNSLVSDMPRRIVFLSLALAAGALISARPVQAKTDFDRDIRPVLSNTCFVCHGPDATDRKTKLRMDVRSIAVSMGAIVPGKPAASEAYRRLTSKDPGEQMPPPSFTRRLTPAQIETVRQWIAEGAEYKLHWSYEKLRRPALPVVKDQKWVRNPIDNFVLAHLESMGLHPQPEADRYSLIRRVSLDLTGLPPTPEEADAFASDKSPDAYEHVVDRLLASPAYGEHQARRWLDLARYADSAGYADDPSRTIWAYRDYVIRSFNDNKPFDQFTIEQIAGDLLPNPTDDQLIATAFHRNTMTNNEGGTDDEEFRNVAVVDRVNTTMAVWMGTSMACAQCHDHKYDPIKQTEYFKMFAIFNQSADSDKRDEAPFISIFTPEQKAQRAAWEIQRASLEKQFDEPPAAVVEASRGWAHTFPLNLDWTPLKPNSVKAQSGTAMAVKDDVVQAAAGAKNDIYTVEAPLTAGKLIALRLEALQDATAPGQGTGAAGGNGVVTRVRASLVPPAAQQSPKARFVRIELPGKDKLLQLAEVQVFSGGENVALKGEARQSSTYDDAEAKRAIDGNTAGEYEKHSVAHTGIGDASPWWEVDLKSERPLDRVVIWNRAELPERLQGFRILALDEKRQVVWKKEGNDAPKISVSLDLSGVRDLSFTQAVTDFTQPGFDARDVLGSATDKTTAARGWAIGGTDKSHTLSLLAEQPVDVLAGSRLVFIIEQQSSQAARPITRFRLDSTTDSHAAENLNTPPDVLAILATPQPDKLQETRLASYYARTIAPELKPVREQLAVLTKEISELMPTTVPVMRDLPADQRRKTHVQIRGNYLSPGDEVTAGLPAAFHPAPKDSPMNRLTLAKWLVDDNNPLTARVTANRFWEDIFGIGLVRTSEEFGAQGELPSNPELLDYLASELMRNHWNVKQLLKLMVTSAAYRQSSKVTPALLEKDPDNRFISRGPRFRMNAESVRDQALFVGGLLSHKMYGPPVRPIRPSSGLNAAFGGGLDWQTSEGEDRHRRSLYTEWRRTSPYPSMSTFDSPNREVCTLRRSRTNTPLQALVTMNDPVFVEAAQGLARRIAAFNGSGKTSLGPPMRMESSRESTQKAGYQPPAPAFAGKANSNAAKAAWGVRLCLARPARESEVRRLLQLYDDALAYYRANPTKAAQLATDPIGPVPPGADTADLAAWTAVANVLLNLDETLMKR